MRHIETAQALASASLSYTGQLFDVISTDGAGGY